MRSSLALYGGGFILVVLSYLFAVEVQAEERMKITLTDEEYPPLSMGSVENPGLLTNIVRESFKLANVDVDFVVVPNNRAIAGLLRGLYDGSYGWAHTPDRDAKLLYSSKPIYSMRMVFFQKNNGEISWNSLQDLGQYKIGVTLGNFYSEEFTALSSSGKLFTDSANTDATNFKKLLLGRIQLFPIDQDVGQYLLKKYFNEQERKQIIFQSKPVSVVPVYFVVRRDLKQAKEFCDRFDRGYQQLVSSGQLEKLMVAYKAQFSDKP